MERPRPSGGELLGHSVDTAAEKDWDSLVNGDLIERAEQEGYEILITTDQSMRYQQNLAGRRLAIIVLLRTAWPYVRLRIEGILEAVAEAQPGELREVPIQRR